jgi:formylglycine-generating enzyme required for sulfatase activity
MSVTAASYRQRLIRLSGILLTGCLCSAAHAVTIDMVTVGNPGNANDTTGYGAVAYEYQIGKYDVTISQYTAFLNAVDPNGTNPNDIYKAEMGTRLAIAGISYTAEAGAGSKYAVINSGNRPITYVGWFEAARFANWMTNGQGSGSAETGAYTLNNATSGNAVAVNPGVAFRLPTINEWYKAAYYSPNYGGVGSPGYYEYATQSDTAPGNVVGPGTNHANYRIGDVYSVTQSSIFSSSQNYLTDVGAFSGSASFYGTFDQSGNVFQWTDLDATPVTLAGWGGGSWTNQSAFGVSRLNVGSQDPTDYRGNTGFRLASPVNSAPVPEIDPTGMGSVLALVTGALGLIERRRLKAA